MINKFALVGISGLVVCGICLAAAAAVGGKALRDAHYDFGGLVGGGDRCDFDPSGQQGSRSLAWNGGDSVAIAIPAMVHYRPGAGDQVVIKGDTRVLSHIRISDSTLKMDCNWRESKNKIDVTLPGRPFRGFKIAGAGGLRLDAIDQPDLKISIAGAGDIEANGKTDNLYLEMAGAGEARLGTLAANRVRVRMAGANNAEVAPIDDLNVKIAGLGDVKLLTEPHKIESDIAGAGHIIHPHELDKDD
jgi:hypothetical protein